MSEETAVASAVEFTLKDGTVVKYESDFVFEDKYHRKTRVECDGEGEGPWAWVHPDDLADHDNDVQDDRVRLVVSANQCLCGLPWGAIYPVLFMGENRPECNMNELIDMSSVPVVHPVKKKEMDDGDGNDT